MNKQDQAFIDIINKMFEISGYEMGYDDVVSRDDDWYNQYTMTMDQYKDWIKWGSEYLRKKFRMTVKYSENIMRKLAFNYGLKFREI